MQFIGRTQPKLLIADENKHIRDKNDVYTPEKRDEQGNVIQEEHIPYYTELIFLGDQINSLEECEEMYIEEEKGE